MSFLVQSVSVQTRAVKRINAVLARTKAANRIAYAAVYNCRKISGTNTWSQHSWGNATDVFPKTQNEIDDAADRRAIADAIVYQATHRTKANHFRRLQVARVINHSGRRMWTPAGGWGSYSGAYGNHVHAEGAPTKLGTPPCA